MAVARAWVASPVRELFERSKVTLSLDNTQPPFQTTHYAEETERERYWPGPSWQESDTLTYGYHSLATTIGTLGLGMSVIAFTLLVTIKQHQSIAIAILSTLAIPIGILIFWLSGIFPANRFIVFDRERQLVYFTQRTRNKIDSSTWTDSSYLIYDENHVYRPYSYCNTKVALIRPPHDLIKDGAPPSPKAHKLMDLDGKQFSLWHTTEAEAIYRYIVAFMTAPPTEGPAAEVAKADHELCDEHYAGNWDLMRRIEGWRWYRLDPSKLPDQPNWIRHSDGRWERTGPGVKALRPWWDNLIKPRRPAINQNTQNPDT
ncbi:hypothetical protein [Ectothiorhodospira variabilis]|uniref:hypothetical protein n=1 Tax=Ectothiorhodospira variabilis TaxID=505694 RepID=UPI001EFAE129|nr:hypothetical protein [Ectothiorhodospira variabilis]MCG5498479.1 hypothetical protein [Ectothiorhodospira variabilis]